jgi:hypothetical protein
VRELELIRAAVEKEVPVLRLSSARVLSAVLGGHVEYAPVPELGCAR